MEYNWLRALHIIAMVTWFAGLFYIFRLYVYHVENAEKGETTALLEVMERRLYRGICWPGMVATTLFGFWLLSRNMTAYLALTWFQVKLVGLVFLFGYHFYAGKIRIELAEQRCQLTSRQCRLINEVPTVILIVVVIMAAVKPFGI